tara:strand:- start:1215 stop:2075 length:861 start_codon:yes stop_codon:yes gene_type:complete
LIKDYLNQIRIIQWLKNLIIFFPLLITLDFNKFNIELIKVFISFSLLSSFFYCINDYRDYEKDIINPTKKNRPYASGKINKKELFLISSICIFLSISVFFTTNTSEIINYFILYVFLNILYNLSNKSLKYIDIIILLSFYYLRLEIGSRVSIIELSNWVTIIFLIFFFHLAILKRYYEIIKLKKNNLNFRNYFISDLKIFDNIIFINFLIFIFVNLFYIFSENAKFLNIGIIEFIIVEFICVYILYDFYKIIKSNKSDKDFFNLIISVKKNYLFILFIFLLLFIRI